MARTLYGASSADFAVEAVDLVEHDSVLVLSPGVVMDVFDALGGTQITDLLATTGPTYDQGAAASQVTSRANGTIPFYPPDGVTQTLYLRTSDGIGGYYWYAVSPSNLATLVSDLTTLVGTGGGGSSNFSGAYADLTGIPAGFPPDPHTQGSGTISDSTTVGRAVLTAPDAPAARTAIGAGTGNGSSNLTLGTTATTAAAGNHAHSAAQVAITPITGSTAQNVQTALTDLSNRGTGGTTETYLALYASGAYPTQPASAPAGVKVRQAYGPIQPSYAAWTGVLDRYDYAPLT